jgi:hypothetical protein
LVGDAEKNFEMGGVLEIKGKWGNIKIVVLNRIALIKLIPHFAKYRSLIYLITRYFVNL